jgi:methionine biosynthesis protein MetW
MLTSGDPDTGQMSSPDQGASGLVQVVLDPLRYDVDRPFDSDEVTGIVANMIPAGVRVLDVGCGAGALVRVLRGVTRAEFLGIEPDAMRAERARSHGLNVRTGYLTRELVNELGLFDIVLLTDVLEHLPDPQSLLLIVREALRPGGIVIISVPNVAHWSVRLCLLRGIFQYQPSGIMDATHLRWFTADSIKSLLAYSGFKVMECRATAGHGLPDNDYHAPLRWLSASQRRRFLRIACRRWPALFGAQYVLKVQTL